MARRKTTKGKAAPIKAQNTYNSKAIESIFGSPKKAWNKKTQGNNNVNGKTVSKKSKKNKSPTTKQPPQKMQQKQQQQQPKNTGNQKRSQAKQQQQLQQANLLSQAAKHNKPANGKNTSGSSSKRSKKNNPKAKKAPKVNNSVRKFQLRLPAVSPNAPPAPWWRNPPTRALSSSSPRRASRDTDDEADSHKILDAIVIKQDSLRVLNDEIAAFADYVRLNPVEIKSRHYLIKTIQNLSKDLFQVEPCDCQVFGSFAAQDVCTFESDIDMAIWGVVAPEEGEEESDNEEEEEEDMIDWSRKEAAAPASKPAQPVAHPNQRKQAKILKWKKALDSHYLAENDDDAPLEAKDAGENATKTSEVVVSKKPPAENDVTTVGTEADTGDAEPVLFVIDRVGEPCTESTPITTSPEGIDQDAKTDVEGASARTVSEDSLPSQEGEEEPSQFEDAEAEEAAVPENPALAQEKQVDASAAPPSIEESQFDDAPGDKLVPNLEDNSNDDAGVDNEDSDNDSADKLEGLKQRSRTFSCDSETRLLNLPDADEVFHSTHASLPQASAQEIIDVDDDDDEDEGVEEIKSEPKVRKRSHSVISLCSSASEGSEKGVWDSSGMEVSFVTVPTSARPPSNTGAASFGPSGEIKVLIVRKLNLLQRWLRRVLGRVGAIEQSHVRKHARVPIVNMLTSFGYECDIALGGHNGTDTSGYAGAQIKRFQSFSTVVLFLKVLLCQHDLDKPFSGGLGSFKLYVLVANHVSRMDKFR